MPTAQERTQIRAIVRGLERVTERVIIKITTDVTANLIETTPVDLGWARANWVPSLGAPVVKELSRRREKCAIRICRAIGWHSRSLGL